MALTINSNILSLNAQRRFGEATKSLSESFSKLSSGLRINKASDDAAGLAISENLKTDTKLASQAIRNVNDGVSMVSIISGALESQKGILYRMAELAEQSANGTNSQAQRNAMQQEYMSLQEEFDRVASSATFNGISLLRNPDGGTLKLLAGITGADESLLSVAAANSHRFAGEYQMQSNRPGTSDAINLDEYFAFLAEISENPWTFSDPIFGKHIASTGAEFQITGDFGTSITVRLAMVQQTASVATNLNLIWGARDSDINNFETGFLIDGITENTKSYSGSGTLVNSGETFRFRLDLSSLSFSDNYEGSQEVAFVKPLSEARPSAIGFTNISSEDTARTALDTVKNRIEDLSTLQGSFGALESRLSVAVNKLQVDRENYQSASSQITDIDVGIESSKLVRGQILQQAAGSILAQANQQPSLALRLLGGI